MGLFRCAGQYPFPEKVVRGERDSQMVISGVVFIFVFILPK